jgi:Protein of unknown function (DUF3918)
MARKSSLLGLGLGAGALAMKLMYDNKWYSQKSIKKMRKSLRKML